MVVKMCFSSYLVNFNRELYEIMDECHDGEGYSNDSENHLVDAAAHHALKQQVNLLQAIYFAL